MKKMYIIQTVVLLLVFISIQGKAKNPESAIQDTLKLNLINPVSQNIQINCINLHDRIYFIDDLVLTKSDIKRKKLCFFLNKNLIVTDASTEDVCIPLMQYRNVRPWDFSPELEEDTYSIINSKCRVYEFIFDDVDSLKDMVAIKLKYRMVQRDTTQLTSDNKKSIYLKGTEFWYPRNIYRNADVSLLVKTTDQIIFSLNSKAIVYDREEYLKEYTTAFMDDIEKPAYVIFKKSELK